MVIVYKIHNTSGKFSYARVRGVSRVWSTQAWTGLNLLDIPEEGTK